MERKNKKFYYECYHDHEKYYEEKLNEKHFKERHPEDHPFYCEICNKSFIDYNSLENHYGSKKHKKKAQQ